MTHDYKKALDLLNEHGEDAYVFELGGSETIRKALELAIALQPKQISEASEDKAVVLCVFKYDISALPKPEASE